MRYTDETGCEFDSEQERDPEPPAAPPRGRGANAMRMLRGDQTLAAFSASIGVSIPHVHDMEKGRRHLNATRAAAIERALRLRPGSLVETAFQDELDRNGIELDVTVVRL